MNPSQRLPDPCINICRMDTAGYCQGCRRTPLEIGRWARMTDQERLALMAELSDRRRGATRPVASAAQA